MKAINDITSARNFAERVQRMMRTDYATEVSRTDSERAVALSLGAERWDQLPATLKGNPRRPDTEVLAKNLPGAEGQVGQALIASLKPRGQDKDLARSVSLAMKTEMVSQTSVRTYLPFLPGLVVNSGALAFTRDLMKEVERTIDRIEKESLAEDPMLTGVLDDIMETFEDAYPVLKQFLSDPTDPRHMSFALIALDAWMNVGDDFFRNMAGHQADSIDETAFTRMIDRQIKARDAHGLGDALGQIPRGAKKNVLSWMASAIVMPLLIHADVDGYGDRPRGALPLERASPEEPHARGSLTRNWGPAWRRLDAPDLVMISRQDENRIFGNGWIKVISDENDDDLQHFQPVRFGGEKGDIDDVVWVVGLGSNPDSVHPVAAMKFIRDAAQQGTYITHIGELETDLPADKRRSEQMGMLAAMQVADDMESLLQRDDDIVLEMSAITPNANDAIEGRAPVAMRFAVDVHDVVRTVNSIMGSSRVAIKANDGSVNVLERIDVEPHRTHDGVLAHDLVKQDTAAAVIIMDDRGARKTYALDEEAVSEARSLVEDEEPKDDDDYLELTITEAMEEIDSGFDEDIHLYLVGVLDQTGSDVVILRRSPTGMTPAVDALVSITKEDSEDMRDCVERALTRYRSGDFDKQFETRYQRSEHGHGPHGPGCGCHATGHGGTVHVPGMGEVDADYVRGGMEMLLAGIPGASDFIDQMMGTAPAEERAPNPTEVEILHILFDGAGANKAAAEKVMKHFKGVISEYSHRQVPGMDRLQVHALRTAIVPTNDIKEALAQAMTTIPALEVIEVMAFSEDGPVWIEMERGYPEPVIRSL